MYTAHTYYSLLYGTMSVEELAEEAAKHRAETLVITDINNSSAIFDFLKSCREKNIRPVFGMDFVVNNHRLYTCIARNNNGVREINEHLTTHNLDQKALSSSAPEFSDVFVLYAPGSRSFSQLRENEFIGVRPWEINKVYSSPLRENMHKLVAHTPVSFAVPQDYEFHRHLRAIAGNTLLSKLTPQQMARKESHFLSPPEVKKIYAPYPSLLKNSEQLLSQCSFSLDFKTPKNKKTFTSSRYDDLLLLEKLAMDGLNYRYGKDQRANKGCKTS
jgi:DNA polymerase III alpha subunit